MVDTTTNIFISLLLQNGQRPNKIVELEERVFVLKHLLHWFQDAVQRKGQSEMSQCFEWSWRSLKKDLNYFNNPEDACYVRWFVAVVHSKSDAQNQLIEILLCNLADCMEHNDVTVCMNQYRSDFGKVEP